MSRNKTITLGLRSSSGRKRIEVPASASGSIIRNAIQKELDLAEDFHVKRDLNGRPGDQVILSRSSNVNSLRLKSGDVLYITPVAGSRFVASDDPNSLNGSNSNLSVASSSQNGDNSGYNVNNIVITQDQVDMTLAEKDGRIKVKRTPNCQHKSDSQKCIYCTDREPYDEQYMKDQGIKHMSFHSYLRKLQGGMDKGKYAALEDISCKIKKGCTTHKPWPASICSSCQPPAITLNRQKYRHVDNVQFENPQIVEKFLFYWRNTSQQRMGYLYGRYEVFEDVPLGIKAVVAAIYEPPQECGKDAIKLIPDDKDEIVDAIAKNLGLQKVGWIFTDLVQDSKGKIKHFRHVDTHFLSAQEIIFAGHFQNLNPNACKMAKSGTFGSKFCTVVVTGNQENQVHMEGYQVSNQCMALVRDSCLLPTKDAPELGYVRKSSAQKYVPDVFFKEKDKYGNEVTKVARPLPVEYLLIDLPVSSPLDPVNTFHVSELPFPIENRPMEGQLQDFGALASYRKQFGHDKMMDFFKDFHLLIYLATQTVSPLYEHMQPLLEAVKDNKDDVLFAFVNSEHWQTIELLLEAQQGGFQ